MFARTTLATPTNQRRGALQPSARHAQLQTGLSPAFVLSPSFGGEIAALEIRIYFACLGCRALETHLFSTQGVDNVVHTRLLQTGLGTDKRGAYSGYGVAMKPFRVRRNKKESENDEESAEHRAIYEYINR